jgi:paraquat-inducible protein B
MARRVSSTAIGGFVLASLGLAAIAALVLGSGKLLQRPHDYICMFEGNLNGLKIGAAVKIRGVQIGTVTQISLRLRPGQGELRAINIAQQPLAVLLQVDEREFKAMGGRALPFSGVELDKLIKQGLRAQLGMESLLTGILYIDLGFHPNPDPTRRSPRFRPNWSKSARTRPRRWRKSARLISNNWATPSPRPDSR